jgi:hypothetical protein
MAIEQPNAIDLVKIFMQLNYKLCSGIISRIIFVTAEEMALHYFTHPDFASLVIPLYGKP